MQRKFGHHRLATALAAILIGTGALAADLPLEQGYFVSNDTPCAEASNATLQLVTRHEFNWSQQGCAIAEVTPRDSTTFAVALDCEETTDFPAERLNVTLTVPDPQHFGVSYSGEPPSQMHYCAQFELPEPWSTNDLSGFID
jgi:hypothetical protein